MPDQMRANIHEALLPYAVPLDGLEQHPQNPKEHEDDAIKESLILNGQFSPIIVQKARQRIIAGHGTWTAAAGLGWTHIAAVQLDVDDDTALRLLLRDNRSHEKSKDDPEALLALLRTLDGEFAGTGFTAADFTDLLSVVESHSAAAATLVEAPMGSTDLRTLILSYQAETFDPLIAAFQKLQLHPGETFTEVVQRLVAQAKADA